MRWWCGWSRTPGLRSGGTPSADFESASLAAFPSAGSECRSRRPSHRGRTTPPRPAPSPRGWRLLRDHGGNRYPGIVTGRLPFDSVQELQAGLRAESYLADRGLATAIYLAVSLDKPLLLEGEAGVGKTEVAKALATLLSRELIRLQCYEGIDASQALYEWNYSRQLIAVRAMQDGTAETHVEDLFGPEYLVERPLLAAIRSGSKAVLLVDELDRADGPRRHVQSDPRAARRPEAPVPVPLDRPPLARTRGRDRSNTCTGRVRDHCPRCGRGCGSPSVPGRGEASRRGGDDRLGQRVVVPRRRALGRGHRTGDTGCGAEGSRGSGAGRVSSRRGGRRRRRLSPRASID